LNRLLTYAQLYRELAGGWTLTDVRWSGEAATK